MSEPAKDKTDLVQRMARAMHELVYGKESAWMDSSKIEQSYREMEADAILAAIRAAGWAVVPKTELDTLRRENEPSKNEAALMEWVGRAIWHHGDGKDDAEAAIAGGEAMDDTHGGIFWVSADDGSLVSATPGEACDEIKRLRAENARLREALVYIGDVCIRHDQGNETGRVLGYIADNTRAALEWKP
jgi:hypothetical protein